MPPPHVHAVSCICTAAAVILASGNFIGEGNGVLTPPMQLLRTLLLLLPLLLRLLLCSNVQKVSKATKYEASVLAASSSSSSVKTASAPSGDPGTRAGPGDALDSVHTGCAEAGSAAACSAAAAPLK